MAALVAAIPEREPRASPAMSVRMDHRNKSGGDIEVFGFIRPGALNCEASAVNLKQT